MNKKITPRFKFIGLIIGLFLVPLFSVQAMDVFNNKKLIKIGSPWNSTTEFVYVLDKDVGIGTNEPAHALTVRTGPHNANIAAQTGYAASITHSDNSVGKYGLIVGTNWLSDENFVANFGNYSAHDGSFSSHLAIKGDGKVGIGITNPGEKFEVQPDAGDGNPGVKIISPDISTTESMIQFTDVANAGAWWVGMNNPSTNFAIYDGVGAIGTRLTIDQSGNVGINKADPYYTLDVGGDMRVSGNIMTSGDICIGNCN